MTAEMQIRLIDDNPEAQAAFRGDNPTEAVPPITQPADPRPATPQPADAPEQGTSETANAGERFADHIERLRESNAAGLDDVVFSVEDLSNQINELVSGQRERIDTEEHRRVGDGIKEDSPADDDTGKEIANAVESLGSKLRDSLRSLSSRLAGILSQTKTGRTILVTGGRIADAGKAAAGRVANSRAGQAVGAGLSRVGIGTAGRAAAAGAGATAGGAGAGAAAAGTGLAAALGPVGVAAAVIAAALASAAIAVRAFTGVMNSVGDEIEDFSADVAIGRAQSQIAREFSRLDRAQRLGAGVASVESSQSRLQESAYQLQTEMLAVLVRLEPAVSAILDATADGVDIAAGVLSELSGKSLAEIGGDIAAQGGNPQGALGAIIGKAVARSVLELNNKDDNGTPPAIDPIFQAVLDADLDPKLINPPGPLPLS